MTPGILVTTCVAEGYRAFECPDRSDSKDNRSSNKKSVIFELEKSLKKQKIDRLESIYSAKVDRCKRRGVK